MRVALSLLFLAYAFDDVASPTDDPDEMDVVVLLDEYSTAEDVSYPRALQNATGNITIPPPPEESPLPLGIMAAVGGVGAVIAGCLLMRPAYTYETHDYDHAADSGLLDHPDYDLEYDDGSDYAEE
jgi:hypothetical protein